MILFVIIICNCLECKSELSDLGLVNIGKVCFLIFGNVVCKNVFFL